MIKIILLTLYLTSVIFYISGQIYVQLETNKRLKKIGYIKNKNSKNSKINYIIAYLIVLIVSLIPIYNFLGGLVLHLNKEIKSEVMILKIETGQYIKKT